MYQYIQINIKQITMKYSIMLSKVSLFIVSLFHSSIAWDNSFLLPNVPIDRWSHIRKTVIEAQGDNAKILDIGCGLGFSTSETPGSLGIDVSREMIEKARVMFPQKRFRLGVVGSWTHDIKYDVSTCMFYLHGMPHHIRKNIINTARNTATKRVVIVDVCPEFEPDDTITVSKPHLKDFQKTCRDDLHDFNETVLVKGHIHQWELELEPDIESNTNNETDETDEDESALFKKFKMIDDETLKRILRFYRPM